MAALDRKDSSSSTGRVSDGVGEVSESTSLLDAGGQDGPPAAAAAADRWAGYEEFAGEPWWRRPSVWWLLAPYALFTLAFGGSIVPKLNLIIDLVCQKYFSDRAAMDPSFTFAPVLLGRENPQCTVPEVQKHVATFMLVLNVVVGVLSAFTVPRLGALSDRYGRKKLMVISSGGGIINEIVVILAARYPEVVHYKWLIAGAVFDGLAGSFTAGSVIANSYTSDCTPPSKRGVAIGYLHACLFSGLAFGPLLAGYFVKLTGSLLSIFYVSLSCHVFFILFILFVIPESVSPRRQMLAREKHAKETEAHELLLALAQATPPDEDMSAPARALYALARRVRTSHPFAPLKILVPAGPGTARLRRNLVLLAAIDMVILGVALSAGQVVLLYSEYMFGWGNFETSNFISLTSFVRVLVLMGVLPVINHVFRARPAARRRGSAVALTEKNAGADRLELWTLRVAIVSEVLGAAGYIFARSPPVFILCGIAASFGGLGSATIQSSITKHVPPERVGQLLGATGLLHALGRVLSPLIFNGLYAATVESFPQAIFVLLTAMFGVVLICSFFVRPNVYGEDAIGTHAEQPEESVVPGNSDTTLTDEEMLPAMY